MAIDRETVSRVAHLARIAVSEEELDPLARELDQIIGWVEQLQAVDVEDVEPMVGAAGLTLPMREDAVTDGEIRDRVLANAPDAREGFFTVPKVVE